MKPRFKSNDFFALLIAIALIILGFVLYFIHEQSSSRDTQAALEWPQRPTDTELASTTGESLSCGAYTHFCSDYTDYPTA